MHTYRKELLGLFGIPVPTTVFTVIEMERTNVCVDWFKMALESKLLTVVMSMHKGLGAGSSLRVLDENLVKMICDMLRSEISVNDTEYGSDIDNENHEDDDDLLDFWPDFLSSEDMRGGRLLDNMLAKAFRQQSVTGYLSARLKTSNRTRSTINTCHNSLK
jgi:hypothetical protein